MNKKRIQPSISRFLITTILLLFFSNIHSENLSSKKPVSTVDSLNRRYLNWFNLDPVNNHIQGSGADRAYTEFLINKPPKKKIIVAVVDAGIDIHHEDLKGKIWVNKKEIPGNNIDDDNNGYVDDIHGWNFIGNADGTNVQYSNFEYVRLCKQYYPLFKGVKSKKEVPENLKDNYRIYLQCKSLFEKEVNKNREHVKKIEAVEKKLAHAEIIIKEYLGKDEISNADLNTLTPQDDKIRNAKKLLEIANTNREAQSSFNKSKHKSQLKLDTHLNPKLDTRKMINDNPNNLNNKYYGNNDVKGPDASHGTFVAGIISANRSNGIGIKGIADHVEIMVLRTIPDGDEYDKDVALSIRYAVDNGANIINMSFGKNFSPNKSFVDDAVHYAETHNVLLVHAAGNQSNNNDKVMHYPSKYYNENETAQNWLTAGASSMKPDLRFVGVFSNYGKKNVDLFAPGVNIISLYPDNKYIQANGTSFSCPVVSGVAALVWSRYPDLSAIQLKDIIKQSVVADKRLKVYYPNVKSSKRKKTKFSRLSETGGIVNALNALVLAEKISEQR